MRIRVAPHIAAASHRLAIREGRSDQEMLERLLVVGLRSLGAALPAPLPDDDETDRNVDKVDLRVPLPRPKFRVIKELARREGRSGHAMTRIIIDAGLAALAAKEADPA